MSLRKVYFIITAILLSYPILGLLTANYPLFWSTCKSNEDFLFHSWTQLIYMDALLLSLLIFKPTRPLGFVFMMCLALNQLSLMKLGNDINVMTLFQDNQYSDVILVILQAIAIILSFLNILIWWKLRFEYTPKPKNISYMPELLKNVSICKRINRIIWGIYNIIFIIMMLPILNGPQYFLLLIVLNSIYFLWENIIHKRDYGSRTYLWLTIIKNFSFNYVYCFIIAFLLLHSSLNLDHEDFITALKQCILGAFIGALALTIILLPLQLFYIKYLKRMNYQSIQKSLVTDYVFGANIFFCTFALQIPCFNSFDPLFYVWLSFNLFVLWLLRISYPANRKKGMLKLLFEV